MQREDVLCFEMFEVCHGAPRPRTGSVELEEVCLTNGKPKHGNGPPILSQSITVDGPILTTKATHQGWLYFCHFGAMQPFDIVVAVACFLGSLAQSNALYDGL